VTREPAEPLSNDEAPGTLGAHEPPPPNWEEDEDATPAAQVWEAVDGVTWQDATSSASASSARGKPKPSDDDEGDLPSALPIRQDPWRLIHLMIGVALVAVAMWVWVTFGRLTIILTPFGMIVLAITAGFVVARMRATRQEALLSLLSIAAERDMPLAPAISAFADQFGGRTQRRLLYIVSQLNTGTSLPEALEDSRPAPSLDAAKVARVLVWGALGESLFVNRGGRALSRDAILMAWVGHETGRLAPALRLVAGTRPARITAWSALASRLAYLQVIMLVAETLSGFLLYYVTPKFEAIFKDFDVPLPQVTVSMIQFSYQVVRYAWIGTPIMLAQIVMLLYLPFSFAGWMNYKLPIFDRLLRRRHAALVLRGLSVVIEANRPMATGLAILAQHYPARWIRRRLAKAERDIRLGADWIDALWRAGIIRRSDAEVLASAASVGNLAWACRELADTADRRQQLRLQLIIQTLLPIAVILMGLTVAFLCLAYFVPIVTLIQRLS
jgi:type II secretory pathway component PulF